MAMQIVDKASGTPAQLPDIEGSRRGISTAGVLSILTAHTHSTGPGANPVGKLTSEDVVALCNGADNWKEACLNGLEFLASAIAAHNPDVSAFDGNAASWLLAHLSEELREATELHDCAVGELSRRGYDFLGKPLSRGE